MTLAVGARIGPYEVTGSLGAGGMGEVYRARDTRLNRDVALKIIPEAFALDADRVARFEREAQLLASLNHPNIAAIYGLEDAHPLRALVLELVDGDTVADRIARGRIPMDEALPLAGQIAEALEAAHEQGVIHRDLKPANIKLRDDGTVKVLDFGLAKMLLDGETTRSSSLSVSPTITSPAMTQIGMILGTAAYMAPEQARGRAADRRSDVWAFGCVLFEMLSGVQAFAGEDVTDVIAAVVRGDPPWHALPAETPPAVRLLLQRCLEKDRRKRVGDISGALFVLREPSLAVSASAEAPVPVPAPAKRSWRSAALIAASLLAAAAIAAAAVWTLTRTDPPPVSRLAMVLDDHRIARNAPGGHVAISPDGLTVVYVALGSAAPAVYSRRLDSFEATLLAQQAVAPFFRPDGKEIGYAFQGGMRRVAITGGPSVEISRIDGQPRGATWGVDNTIIFATASTTSGLLRVPASGGKAEVLTTPEDGFDHLSPRFLPGGKAVLYTIAGLTDPTASQIAVLDLRSSPPQTKVIVRGGRDARYLSSGHLVYLAGDSLRLLPFDLDRLEATDDVATPVLSGMATGTGNSGVLADIDISAAGTLAYLPAGADAAAFRTLTWVDRSGKETPVNARARAYLYPRLSPDETRIALDVREDDQDIWVWNLLSTTETRVTRDPGLDRTPVWLNNDELLYSSSLDGEPNVYRHRADGTGKPVRAAENDSAALFPLSLAGDRLIVTNTRAGISAADLMLLPVAPSGTTPAQTAPKPEPLVAGPAGEINGTVSPDGRWLAYQSNESGPYEVYVQPYGKGTTGLRQAVSQGGGQQPRWAANSQELYYISARNEMMVVTVQPGTTWSATQPRRLFDASKYHLPSTGTPFFNYDVSREGRFLMVKSPDADPAVALAPDQILIVQQWIEELRRTLGR